MIGILLAAGFSRRFGANDKLMQVLPDGTPIALKAAQNLVTALPVSVAVLRPENKSLGESLLAIGFNVVFCTEAQQTMADSLSLAVDHAARFENAQQNAEGYVIALADMPFIASSTITNVANHLNSGGEIVVPTYQGKRGHPVAFSAKFKIELQSMQGDQGARELLTRFTAEVVYLPCQDAGILQDIDTPADLIHFKR